MRSEFFQNPLLQFVFVQIRFRADLRRGMRECFLYCAVDYLAGFLMRLKLLRCPAGFESLHQIRRTDHRTTLRANHLHRAGVHEGNVRYGVPWRILHGHLASASDQARKIAVEFVKTGINELLSRQAIQSSGLDAVHQFTRSAAAGNQVEPATRAHPPAIQPQYTGCNRIAMMKIIEEPPIRAGGSQFLLYGIDWRHNLPAQDAVFILHVALRARAPRDWGPRPISPSFGASEPAFRRRRPEMRFRSLRCNGANLLGSHALDFNTLQPAPLT